MPPLNWDQFQGLPGSSEDNFERLCRALIRWHYGQFGMFAARASQPGVEFHLKLTAACTLGDVGRWYGWQCRWYDLPGGRALGSTRKAKIEEAIRTTEEELPDLTDWVLWTRRPLTAGDQQWFNAIQTQMAKHLWTGDDVEHHLSGPAEILRRTYFGDLILTPADLRDMHDRAVAPIKRRWNPAVHQRTNVERMVDRVLGSPTEWRRVSSAARRLQKEVDALRTSAPSVQPPINASMIALSDVGASMSEHLSVAASGMIGGDLEWLRAYLDSPLVAPDAAQRVLPRQLRARRHASVFDATNALDSVTRYANYLRDARTALDTRMIAVVADAGFGKTELAAQMTAEVGDRPAGVLLHGRSLHAGGNLDDLARTVVLHGTPMASMDALVAAVDAAGQRAGRRLPIFIDGLNEAEDPRDWSGPLASLLVSLQRYRYVIVICTTRLAFLDEAVPADIPRLRLRGFARDAIEAIRRYFRYYKIDPADAQVPIGFLRHPLTLRLFCEVTNPTREKVVGVEAMPGSLTALFDRYLAQAASRIGELSSRSHRYMVADVEHALDQIGAALWEKRSRSLDLVSLRQELGDSARPWAASLVQALEQDGVLLRVRGDAASPNHVAVVYDLLAGHLVADARIRRVGRDGIVQWLSDDAIVKSLSPSPPDGHPLATDICRSLAALMPRRLAGQQMWPVVPEPLRSAALQAVALLEGRYIDVLTAAELAKQLAEPGPSTRPFLNRLWHTRGSLKHPLNAEFLDAALRPLPVAERDLIWTEWVRANADEITNDVRRLADEWRDDMVRTPSDRLRAMWLAWILTTTVRSLRDEATRALYWFGRGNPAHLFEIAVSSLELNDEYVAERTLAAAYGSTLAYQVHDVDFTGVLSVVLSALVSKLVGEGATNPTNHWLIRQYALGMFAFAAKYYPSALTAGVDPGHMDFAAGPIPDPHTSDEIERTIQMDFENYTLGRLVDDRQNYDMENIDHMKAVAHVHATTWGLGWRAALFGQIDDRIAEGQWSRSRRKPADRYGKKYGWSGFYTWAGVLQAAGKLPDRGHRLSDVQIDPSFPDRPVKTPTTLPLWAQNAREICEWMKAGSVDVSPSFLRLPSLDGHVGPWVAVCAHVTNESSDKRVFGHLYTVLIEPAEAARVAEALRSEGYLHLWAGHSLPEDHYTFAGEIPWHSEFGRVPPGEETRALYDGELVFSREDKIAVEVLAHWYAWESYHSELNQAGGSLVPAKSFSQRFDLRGLPQAFHQKLPQGEYGALSYSAPEGFTGEVLYLREDLLRRYAGDRDLIWFMSGERQLAHFPHPVPDWLSQVMRKRANEWRLTWRWADLPLAAVATGRSRKRRI